MNLNVYLTTISLLWTCAINAQNHNAWVVFTDKGPELSLTDGYDTLPVYHKYCEAIEDQGLEVIGSSRWFNAAYVEGQEIENKLEGLHFVMDMRPVRPKHIKGICSVLDNTQSGYSQLPLSMLQLDSFHRKGFTGSGVLIGLFDAGFTGVDTLLAFTSLKENGQLIDVADFVQEDSVYTSSHHGTAVLGLTGITYADTLLGAAPGAQFLLARTEDVRSETHREELYWVQAMEWAHSLGVDVIHSSLGYSEFDSLEGDYTYIDMDGASTIITLATDVASNKGILVTNSAGNQGELPWRHITAPCDGFQVLCIGAVDSFEQHASFSSYGPSFDGRVKPEVMAMGKNIHVVLGDGRIRASSGTSFSGPLIAGLCACLKQAHPSKSNEEIKLAVIRSADRFTNPDSAYGYGIPNVLYADSLLRNDILRTENVSTTSPQAYPNPSNGFIGFRFLPKNSYLRIFSMSGALLLEAHLDTDTTLQLPEFWKNGTYVWDVAHDNLRYRGIFYLLRE